MKDAQRKIQQQAARWFARMQNAEPDHPERGKFEAWLMSSELHAAAYAKLAAVWDRFDNTAGLQTMASAVESSKQRKDERAQKQRRRLVQGLAGLFLVAVGAVLGMQVWSAHQPLMQLASTTEVGQIKKEILDDGSELVINSNTELTIRYYQDRRTVHITRGEVIFNVAKDTGRPFIIDSGLAKVTVLGTRFVVNRLSKLVRVSVDHGSVKVESPHQGKQSPLILTNGQVAEISVNQAAQRVNRNAMDAFEFENGTIAFEEADLTEIAEALSRHYHQPISVIPSHKNPKVTALVQTRNIEGFLRTLPRIAAVNVQQDQTQTTLSAR
jgi:transmembrane sensor